MRIHEAVSGVERKEWIKRQTYLSLFKPAIASVFLLTTLLSYGQVKYSDAPALIRDVLRQGATSGSIISAADDCEMADSQIPVPTSIHAPKQTGSTVEQLKDMFSEISGMVVTKDSNGIIRMVQKGVPTDILDLRIRFVVFSPSNAPFPQLFHGPNMALVTILSSPEVRLFMKQHNITPPPSRLEGHMGQNLPPLTGQLHDVTLSQALDYVLQSFPGYWVYESCTTKEGRRAVNFHFYY